MSKLMTGMLLTPQGRQTMHKTKRKIEYCGGRRRDRERQRDREEQPPKQVFVVVGGPCSMISLPKSRTGHCILLVIVNTHVDDTGKVVMLRSRLHEGNGTQEEQRAPKSPNHAIIAVLFQCVVRAINEKRTMEWCLQAKK